MFKGDSAFSRELGHGGKNSVPWITWQSAGEFIRRATVDPSEFLEDGRFKSVCLNLCLKHTSHSQSDVMPIPLYGTTNAYLGKLGLPLVLEREIGRTVRHAKASGGSRVGNMVVGESRTEQRVESLDVTWKGLTVPAVPAGK